MASIIGIQSPTITQVRILCSLPSKSSHEGLVQRTRAVELLGDINPKFSPFTPSREHPQNWLLVGERHQIVDLSQSVEKINGVSFEFLPRLWTELYLTIKRLSIVNSLLWTIFNEILIKCSSPFFSFSLLIYALLCPSFLMNLLSLTMFFHSCARQKNIISLKLFHVIHGAWNISFTQNMTLMLFVIFSLLL